jgi:hypothetical protein
MPTLPIIGQSSLSTFSPELDRIPSKGTYAFVKVWAIARLGWEQEPNDELA